MRYASTGSQAGCRQPRSIEVPTNDPSSGFTLFETLTAMLVLSIALVSLFEAHSRALRTAGIATDYTRARIFGQGLLADTLDGWTGKLVSKKGTNDGLSWSIDVTPATAPWANIETRDNWKLRHVRVLVSWGDGRQIELDSLKLGRANG